MEVFSSIFESRSVNRVIGLNILFRMKIINTREAIAIKSGTIAMKTSKKNDTLKYVCVVNRYVNIKWQLRPFAIGFD